MVSGALNIASIDEVQMCSARKMLKPEEMARMPATDRHLSPVQQCFVMSGLMPRQEDTGVLKVFSARYIDGRMKNAMPVTKRIVPIEENSLSLVVFV